MSRFRDGWRGGPRALLVGGLVGSVLLVGGLTGGLLGAGPGRAAPAGDGVGAVEEIVGAVEDLGLVVESLDQTESSEQQGRTVTVTLTSDVLFAVDKSDISPAARSRLEAVAAKIRADSAGGLITIAGHTDDQSGDAYNQALSERRAESVRAVLASLLTDQQVTFKTVGYGESRPRVPNIVDGKPSEANRTKNRRVEITYDVRQ